MTTAFETLSQKISARNASVGVIGFGYVGLPLAATLHKSGLSIIAFDVDETKIEMLKRGENYLKHLGEEMTQILSKSDRFDATSDFSRLAEADVLVVCVPTPINEHQEPDLSYVLSSAESIGKSLRKEQLILLESTTYPGTTRGVFLDAIRAAASGPAIDLRPGEDYFVAFSPEREDPGRASHSTSTIPKLVGGLDEASTRLATDFYRCGIEKVIEVSSAEIAEGAKILENVFRAVNIAMVNELKVVLDAMGIDIWEVIEAAGTKPFGFMPFYPGPGLGGHCIPIDPFYLTWQARAHGQQTRFIELAGEINQKMPGYVVDRIARGLNDDAKAVKGSNVLILGLAYKPDVDDTRETPAAEIIKQLAERGANVTYHDPHVKQFPKMRKYKFEMESLPLTPEVLKAADCVVMVTDHKAIDMNIVGEHAKLVVDTRNAMASVKNPNARVVKA